MKSTPLIAVGAVVLVAAAGVGYWLYADAAERSTALRTARTKVEAELATSPLDTSSATALLRELDGLAERFAGADVDRLRARLLLALQRLQQAWDVIEPHASAPEVATEDLELGSRVLFGLHALGARAEDGTRALAFAVDHADRTGSVASRFRAWQLAFRIGDLDAWDAAARRLQADASGSYPARVVAALTPALCYKLADRLGVAGDLDAFRKAATRGDGSRESILGALLVESVDDGVARDRGALEELGREAEPAPAELRVEIAAGLVETQDEERIFDAIDVLRTVLSDVPASVDARHVIAVAHFGVGERNEAGQQLDWLLKNAPDTDSRRSTWQSLKEASAAGR